ncbi:uncharacterized protein EV420DRAFT_1485705 [Desarmillaria tabescens]|uniref:Uncharacterized protein n=1 Tax=Armillaria tabescens TaxID=1929756 RepID=A0AA39JEQ4_ARMTA|nr:uncharacterized protein EV420DRAFT_1485705 [Desarmillaria tabescens]KAK0441248.1 hypothetical protein EV420DRAFT_1485705 [Desarmillaria tabescens]
MVGNQDSALDGDQAKPREYFRLGFSDFKRGIPPRIPLRYKCILYGTDCKWSFNRSYDCHRHKRQHLEGDARAEHLHYCPLGTGCPLDFKNLQLGNLRIHIKTIQPFVLTTDLEAFAQHQAEKHGDLQPSALPRIITSPLPSETPVSSPPALSQHTTPAKITLVPLATLIRGQPAPMPPKMLPCSFIQRARLPLPEDCCLTPIMPHRHDSWHCAAPTPYKFKAHSRIVPTLRNFLRDDCGIELIPKRRLIHCHLPSLTGPFESPESALMSSGSSSSSPDTSHPGPHPRSPISQQTTNTSTLRWVGAVTVSDPINDTQYSRFRFVGDKVLSTRPDSQVFPAP